jgi:hypothetical protein
MQGPQHADLQPAGFDTAVPGAARRCRDHQGVGAPAPTLLPSLTAGCEVPARLAQALRALQGSGHVAALVPAERAPHGAPILGRSPHADLDACGGVDLPHEVGGPRGRMLVGDAPCGPRGWRDLQPEAPQADVLPEVPEATHTLVSPARAGGRGVLQRGDRVHRLAPCGWHGVVKAPGEGFPLAGREDAPPCLGRLAEGGLGLPARDPTAGVDAGPVGRRSQLPRPVGDRLSLPPPGDGQDHQATGGAMIPMNVPVQGLKTLVKRGGNPDDAAHEAMLLEPMGHGR